MMANTRALDCCGVSTLGATRAIRWLVGLFLVAVMVPAMAQREMEGGEERPPPTSSNVGALEALQQFGDNLFGGNDANEFLDPDVAFVLTTKAQSANTLIARWDIADAYLCIVNIHPRGNDGQRSVSCRFTPLVAMM